MLRLSPSNEPGGQECVRFRVSNGLRRRAEWKGEEGSVPGRRVQLPTSTTGRLLVGAINGEFDAAGREARRWNLQSHSFSMRSSGGPSPCSVSFCKFHRTALSREERQRG